MLFRQTQLFQLCPCADDLYLGHTLVRGKDARAPVNLQCCVCTQCTTICPLWTISVTNRPANALKRPGGAKRARPGCAPQKQKTARLAVAGRFFALYGISFYLPASSTASTAFWTWRRFSASSKISSACCSNRAVEISSPRWAGRQCSTSASGFAFSSRRPVS